MTGRVLVVDDLPANVRLLEAKLATEYYEVLTASSGQEALDIIAQSPPDIVLLDIMMPGMDGFEVCKRIKSDPQSMHIPVLMITALDDIADKVRGLEVGADDFLTKPVQDLALFTRIRSVLRLKMMVDELRIRESTNEGLGVMLADAGLDSVILEEARILVIADDSVPADIWVSLFRDCGEVTVMHDEKSGMFEVNNGQYDLVAVDLYAQKHDPLRICSQIRSGTQSRNMPIIAISAGDAEQVSRALDLGVNDFIDRPIEASELHARLKGLLFKRRYTERLRASLEDSVEMAATDPLTGLFNRRYMDSHFPSLVESARDNDKPLSVLMVDIDHFKQVNDVYGHAAGDSVLQSVADLICENTRPYDLVIRLGGEEFFVIMPGNDEEEARKVAQRLLEVIERFDFQLQGPDGDKAGVTVSIGVCGQDKTISAPEEMMHMADDAMYQAKNTGRNRLVIAGAG